MAPYVNPERAAHAAGHPYASTSTSEITRGTASGRGRGGRGGGIAGGNIPTGSVSKLKAQIRQTTRLLAKDDLTPDVRVASERRLKTLQIELEKTTNSNLEQKMVTRYRGVKFFERQKILRKIKQTKKALVGTPTDAELTRTLAESRIDLYYILNYPKTDKYVALFPEGTYVSHPTSLVASAAKDAASVRTNLRFTQKLAMDEGRLVIEAEGGDLGIEGEEDVGAAGERESKVVAVEPEIVTVVVEKKVKKSKKAAVEVVEAVEGDETMQDIPTEVIDPVQKKKGRREKKEEKRNAANGTVAVAEEKVAEGWAGDDEFFA